jgi:uncharacterized protein
MAVTATIAAALPAALRAVQETSLPASIEAVLRTKYVAEGMETRYLRGVVDLDGDGRDEILVHVVGPMACGTGGCPTLVFTPGQGDAYRLVTTLSVTRPPIRASSRRSNGWRNLIVHVAGGGAAAHDAELAFNGKSYPRNPSVAPATPVTTLDGATVVIADVDSFDKATPLAPRGVSGIAPRPAPASAAAAGPSFDCAKAATPVEKRICADTALSALDRMLAQTYATALSTWPADIAAKARADQREWIGTRNACPTGAAGQACLTAAYQARIAELQITSGRLEAPTPVGYVCADRKGQPFTASFYDQTDPRSAVLTFGNDQVIAIGVPAASGARYAARNVDFWEKGGEARVTWKGESFTCRARGR